MPLVEIAGYLITGSVCLIVGCGLGYYTAAKDLEEEKRKAAEDAWNRGLSAARNPYSWDDKNPFTKVESS